MSVRRPVNPADAPDLPYIGLEHIERDTGKLIGSGRPGDVRSSKLYFDDGDVLYSRLRPNLNKVWRATHEGICSTEFIVFSKLDGLDPDFLTFRLLAQDFVAFASNLVGASLYPRVRLPQLAQFEILLPPRPEQTRIAEQTLALLKQADDADQHARAAASRIPEYRRSILNDAISGRLTSSWRKERRFGAIADEVQIEALSEASSWDGDNQPGMALDLLPETWTWSTWRAIGAAQNGRTFPSADYVPEGIRLMRPGNLAADGTIHWAPEHTKHLPLSYLDSHPEFVIQDGDVIMNLTAQSLADEFLGRVCLAGPEDVSLLNQRLARLSAKGVLPRFLLYVFQTPKFRRFIDGLATGSIIQHISTRQLIPFQIPIPPVAEQDEIVRLLDLALRQLKATEQGALAASARVAELRRSVLSRAALGQLTYQNPADGDAATLLESMAAEIEWRNANAQTRTRSENAMVEPDRPTTSLQASLLTQSRELTEPQFLDASKYDVEEVSKFYENLLADRSLLSEFIEHSKKFRADLSRADVSSSEQPHSSEHRFRLVDLWIEEFKNLHDYRIEFNPGYSIDIILGWNGTGKSNLFESLVIIFRDLYMARGKLPSTSFSYNIRYECGGRLVDIEWRAKGRRGLKLKASPEDEATGRLARISRDELPLPRFVFGYYSGPTNRLAEHFLPLDREHYFRLLNSPSDSPETMVRLLEERRFFCAYTHHAKYVMLGFFYKEDEAIRSFLRDRLRIIGFRSAVFVIRKPDWARPGEDETTFWGASGIVRHFLERLRRIAVAPIKVWETVDDGYKQSREEQLRFLIPDIESLRLLAAEYPDARSFFLALESTDFSRMLRDVKVSVRVEGASSSEVPIVFREMSEGEQQLLTVLGLLRFTKAHDSLVLLDEPDTHLNPHWAVDYLELLSRIMGDGEPSQEERSSQILMSTHDPLVIVALEREQIHLLKRDRTTGRCEWELATESPRGLGFTGILTSEMFGFGSDLDQPTMELLHTQAELAGKSSPLSDEESQTLSDVTAQIDRLGFKTATSDPYYRAFIQGLARRSRASDLIAASFRSRDEIEELARETDEILAEIATEENSSR